jgi:hypothetical protein
MSRNDRLGNRVAEVWTLGRLVDGADRWHGRSHTTCHVCLVGTRVIRRPQEAAARGPAAWGRASIAGIEVRLKLRLSAETPGQPVPVDPAFPLDSYGGGGGI